MTLRFLCVGKIKERFYRDAAAELIKRLGRYAAVEGYEAADERTPEAPSPKERARIVDAEGARLLERVQFDDYLIALDIRGEKLSSEALSDKLRTVMTGGKSRIAFAVGGSLGLSDAVLRRADMRLSFGDMTFPHQLFRVMLLEQVYRAFRIMNGEPYHK